MDPVASNNSSQQSSYLFPKWTSDAYNRANGADSQSQIAKDARFLKDTTETLGNATQISDSIRSSGVLTPIAERALGLAGAIFDSINIIETAKEDAKTGNYENTYRVTGTAIGSTLLTGAAVVTAGALGMAAAPAVVLAVGAGLAGAAIGDIITQGVLSFRD